MMMRMTWTSLAVMGLLSFSACHTDGARLGDERPIADRAEDVQPVNTGDRAPTGVVYTSAGDALSLDDQYKSGPTMLMFYRGGWCPFCNEQLESLLEAEQAIADMGIEILAISPDRPAKLQDNPLGETYHRLVSDSDMTVTRAFGLAFRVDDATVEQYQEFGIDLQDASGQTHQLLPVPAVYLIDRDGVIRFAQWEADYRDRLSPDELIEAANAITR